MFACLTPFSKRDDRTGENMNFPCGRCYPCLRRRVSGWSFRLVKEGLRCNSSFFITFTYDTKTVPITSNGFMSLQKRDFQLFVKRLRFNSIQRGLREKIRYFAVGEYGGKTLRPHYHAIMYDVDINEVEKAWVYGNIHVGQVSEASIGYTLKYMMKPSKIPLHKNDDRVPEFQLMSKGLGANYLTSAISDYHRADLLERMYCTVPGGVKLAMPRYYRKKLYTDNERQLIGNHLRKKHELENVDKDLTGQEEIAIFEMYSRKLSKARIQEIL